MKRKNVVVILISLFCLSCGLEDVPYLGYNNEFSRTDNISAIVQLPSTGVEGYSLYFSHFEIYYRIYISDQQISSEINTSALRSQINSSLNSDFQGLYYLTDKTSTSANPTNLETVFSNRRYFKLTLQGANIDKVLDISSLGGTLEIRFSPVTGEIPVLNLNGAVYPLQRANSGSSLVFDPVPDRNFWNHPDLYNNDNVTDQKNADVAKNTQNTPRYTYVSMYIFAIGKDYITTIYSQPTYINIFRLAEAN